MSKLNSDSIEDLIWSKDILLKLVTDPCKYPFRSVPVKYCDKKFQLFELLVAETLALSDSELKWTVTGVQGDGGIDFIGERPAKIIDGLLELPKLVVIGQVKRRKEINDTKVFQEDINKIANLIDDENFKEKVWRILFVVSTSDYGRLLKKISHEDFLKILKRNLPSAADFVLINGEKIISFWAMRQDLLSPFLEKSLAPDANKILREYFAQFYQKEKDWIKLKVEGPEHGLTGLPIVKMLRVRTTGLSGKIQLFFKWTPADSEPNIVQIIRPARIPDKQLIDIGIGETTIELHCRCFAAGPVDLGTIHIISHDGASLVSIKLGIVHFAFQFNPRYYEKPAQEIYHYAVKQLLQQVKAHKSAHLSITGVGGSGKSRLSEAIADTAAQNDFEIISIKHPLNKTGKKKLLLELFYRLCGIDDTNNSSLWDSVFAFLQKTLQSDTPEIATELKRYFHSQDEIFPVNSLVKCMLILLEVKTRNAPLLIHLQDLHWGDKELFQIIENAVDRLRFNEQFLNNQVFWLFEGRDLEALQTDGNYLLPQDWFNFLKNDFIVEKKMPSWSPADSEDFLREMLASSVNRNEFIDPESMPLYEEMIAHVLKYASGNPMHLIEQLKLLLAQGYIEQHNNGLLYVIRRLDILDDIPKETNDLIRYRIEFLKQQSSENYELQQVIELLAFIAKIDRKISSEHFRYLALTANLPEAVLLEVEKLDVASIPRENSFQEFDFHHENYFQVFLGIRLSREASMKWPVISLDWYNQNKYKGVNELLQMSRIHFLSSKVSYDKVIQLIQAGRKLSNDEYLTEAFLKLLLKIPVSILEANKLKDYRIRNELAGIIARVGSWTDAMEQLKELKKMYGQNHTSTEYLTTYLEVLAEIANITTDNFAPSEALRSVSEALHLMDTILALRDNKSLEGIRSYLYNKNAVVYWFNGDIVRAIQWQWKSYRILRDDKTEYSGCCRELGSMLFHRYPEHGVALLKQARQILFDFVPQAHHSLHHLINVQLLMGELLVICKIPGKYDLSKIEAVAIEAEDAFRKCIDKMSLYEASVAALVCGSAYAITQKLTQAAQWFRQAIVSSTHANRLEVLWKAHLNLAQVYDQLDDNRSKVHLHEAYRLLSASLMNDTNAELMDLRRELIRLPLLQILRLMPELKSSLATLIPAIANIHEMVWENRPYYISKSGEQQQLLHVRRNDWDYFLTN